ncbi:adenylate/guanylate cyclase domain-containing protein [Desulfonema magnum]|uniref:Adenylate/guanylate cyclase domain-containing protein n=1 Tax=Desulfonema magnum TaxID=45655 RepID=A0A975BEZ5_9BACT|nr:adenylate/guanylate cyclase domain-containing protein [Desulfonema magnum]QTA84078.1 Adenylate/guanylate cyclase domain-containing protein [Desulfonema magnum]
MSYLKRMTSYFSKSQENFSSTWENYKANKKTDKKVKKISSLAILFANIPQSDQLFKTLGNKNAQKIISACLSLLSKITESHKGRVIKIKGDEIICTFPIAENAVKAGKTMHMEVEKMYAGDNSDLVPPNIRIGIHSGSVVSGRNEIFGDAVTIAAHMTEFAKERQIIITKQTAEALGPEYETMFRCIEHIKIKDKNGKISIHEMIWKPAPARESEVPCVASDSKTLSPRLELRFLHHKFDIDQNRQCVTMGRDPDNDLVVDSHRVSRSHAYIKYCKGKFVLTDQSMNGTCLLLNGKQGMVKNTKKSLHGNGVIGLAQKVSYDSPDAIHFTIRP